MQSLASQAWNNLLVPDDEVPSQDDAGNEPEEEPAPAAEPAAEAPKADWIGRFRRRRRVTTAIEAPRDEEPPNPSGADEENQTTDPKVHVLPEDPPTYVKQRFAQLQAMHDQENERTSPPDGEHVTFWSVTLAELYVGAEIDALAAALQKATWVNTDEQFAEEIATSQQLDAPYPSEFLLRSSPASPSFRESYGETDLPTGIARIIGQLNALGPSLTSLVLTFVLTDEEADCLDRAIRDEADANLRYNDSPVSIETVHDVKSKRVQAVPPSAATWSPSPPGPPATAGTGSPSTCPKAGTASASGATSSKPPAARPPQRPDQPRSGPDPRRREATRPQPTKRRPRTSRRTVSGRQNTPSKPSLTRTAHTKSAGGLRLRLASGLVTGMMPTASWDKVNTYIQQNCGTEGT
jgi:hypothetical protein